MNGSRVARRVAAGHDPELRGETAPGVDVLFGKLHFDGVPKRGQEGCVEGFGGDGVGDVDAYVIEHCSETERDK